MTPMPTPKPRKADQPIEDPEAAFERFKRPVAEIADAPRSQPDQELRETKRSPKAKRA